jgi:hypothetical protein
MGCSYEGDGLLFSRNVNKRAKWYLLEVKQQIAQVGLITWAFLSSQQN